MARICSPAMKKKIVMQSKLCFLFEKTSTTKSKTEKSDNTINTNNLPNTVKTPITKLLTTPKDKLETTNTDQKSTPTLPSPTETSPVTTIKLKPPRKTDLRLLGKTEVTKKPTIKSSTTEAKYETKIKTVVPTNSFRTRLVQQEKNMPVVSTLKLASSDGFKMNLDIKLLCSVIVIVLLSLLP